MGLETNEDVATALRTMVQRVNHQLTDAITAFLRQDPELAFRVGTQDELINADELRTDQYALRDVVAGADMAQKWQSVALLLRVTNELERVGDAAVAIATVAVSAYSLPGRPSNNQADVWLTAMANQTGKMLSMAVHAFLRGDVGVAQEVVLAGQDVDRILVRLQLLLGPITPGESALSVGRLLDQCSNHSVNIAEWVVSSVTGTMMTLN